MRSEEIFDQDRRALPLSGRTIVLTRAHARSAEMTAELQSLGGKVIHCPTIEVVPPDSWSPIDAAIQRLDEYDWLVFTSANGVEFFFRRLSEKPGGALSAIKTFNVCAIGPATAQALQAAGTAVTVVASDSRAEGALAAMIDYIGGDDRIRGLSFLIPRARVARDILPDSLRRLGARVDAIEAYQTVKPNVDRDSVIRLFTENRVDAITFTSSSTVSNLAAMVEQEDLSALLGETIAFCIGPVTTETARRHQIANIVHPQEYNSSALVDSIVKSIGRQ